MTGTAVWAVREDGKLLTNWVERASWEQFSALTLPDRSGWVGRHCRHNAGHPVELEARTSTEAL